jgi:ribonuclease VapC
MAEVVVDTSAFLANVHGEPGGEAVLEFLDDALISAVNYAEVICHLIDNGLPAQQARDLIDRMGFQVVPADQGAAFTIGARLYEQVRRRGVSLGDQFCLALALESGLPVLTADKRWATLDIGVDVRLIR